MSKRTALRSQPRGLMRWFLRMPIWLYKMHLGWLMGNRFIMLHHIGRKSGKIRYAVIEVVDYDPELNVYTVASGWGTQSDWYRNILKNPDVVVSTHKGDIEGKAVVLPVREGASALKDYARRNPTAFRSIAKFVLEPGVNTGDINIDEIAEVIPVLRLVPIP